MQYFQTLSELGTLSKQTRPTEIIFVIVIMAIYNTYYKQLLYLFN